MGLSPLVDSIPDFETAALKPPEWLGDRIVAVRYETAVSNGAPMMPISKGTSGSVDMFEVGKG